MHRACSARKRPSEENGSCMLGLPNLRRCAVRVGYLCRSFGSGLRSQETLRADVTARGGRSIGGASVQAPEDEERARTPRKRPSGGVRPSPPCEPSCECGRTAEKPPKLWVPDGPARVYMSTRLIHGKTPVFFCLAHAYHARIVSACSP
jgi:hypothetical protein